MGPKQPCEHYAQPEELGCRILPLPRGLLTSSLSVAAERPSVCIPWGWMVTSHRRPCTGSPAIMTALWQLSPSLDNTLICHSTLCVSGTGLGTE